MTQKIIVIANPVACGGSGLAVYNRYANFLSSNSIPFETYFTKCDEDETAIRAFINQEFPNIISVIGGDGTLNIVLNSLPNLNYNIHLIPAGTGNDFSKEIYNDLKEDEIFQLIFNESKIKYIDSWKCNEKRFINCFGAGFDGEIAQRMFQMKYTLPPKLKYWLEIFRSIFTYKSTLLTINGKTQPCFMLAAANGKVYGGGFKIAPKAEPIDKLLDLVIIGKVPLIKRFFYLPIIERGKHLDLNIITFSKTGTVKITSEKPLPAQIDGEPMLADSYEISLEGRVGFLVL